MFNLHSELKSCVFSFGMGEFYLSIYLSIYLAIYLSRERETFFKWCEFLPMYDAISEISK